MLFEDLYGNQKIKNILTNYLKKKVLPVSMIFYGPHSANKMKFAVSLTKALNCTQETIGYCNSCQTCQEIENQNFPDMKIISPEGLYFKKEQILFLIEDNYRKPLIADKKTYIINGADSLTENAANTFLKVLEEPAPTSIFILLTSNLQGLLSTIRSRCQILKFSSLPRSEVIKMLADQGYDSEKAELMSHLNLSQVEDIKNFEFDEFVKKRFLALDTLIKLVTRKAEGDVLLDLSDRTRNREKFILHFTELIQLISWQLRDIMVLKFDANTHLVMNIDFKQTLIELSDFMTIDRVLFLIGRMESLRRDIHHNLNAKVLVLEFIKSFTS